MQLAGILIAAAAFHPDAEEHLHRRVTDDHGPDPDRNSGGCPGLDTGRIALSRSATTLDYFAGVSWTDRAPAMVQTLIVESFENSGHVISVGRDTIGLRADYVLKSELREFQAEYASAADNGPPQIHVRINAKLVAMPRRNIEAGKTFEALERARSASFQDIIEAYDDALGKVLRRLVEWSLTEAARIDRQGLRRVS